MNAKTWEEFYSEEMGKLSEACGSDEVRRGIDEAQRRYRRYLMENPTFKFKYQAVGDKVFLEALPVDDSSQQEEHGGILVPRSVKQAITKTVFVELPILSVGPDCKIAKVGMKALVNRHVIINGGYEVAIGDLRFCCLNEPQIAAICE